MRTTLSSDAAIWVVVLPTYEKALVKRQHLLPCTPWYQLDTPMATTPRALHSLILCATPEDKTPAIRESEACRTVSTVAQCRVCSQTRARG